MAYRKLSTMPLDEDVKSTLSMTSLKTVKDVLVLSPLTVMNLLHQSASQCKEFMDHLASMCLPPRITAYEMEQMEQQNSIPLGSHALDTLLHGGLLAGSLTEFVGPAGVGKTQWCLHISASVVATGRNEGTCPSAIYVDTESAVRPERIVEMMKNRYPELSAEIPKFLSRIHVFQPKTTTSMLEILDSLEFIVVEKDARVVIVDSIAAIDDCLSTTSRRVRASQLSSWAAKLKAVAHHLNICVVVTNQITRMLEVQLPEPDLPEPLVTEEQGDHVPHPEGHHVPHPESHISDSKGHMPNPKNNVPEQEYMPNQDHMAEPKDLMLEPTTCPEECVDSAGPSKHIIPAMGNTWTHCITTRIVLQYTDSSARQLVIAKSPVSPFAVFSYFIREDGITMDERDCCYSYSGPDPGLFRIRAQEGMHLGSL